MTATMFLPSRQLVTFRQFAAAFAACFWLTYCPLLEVSADPPDVDEAAQETDLAPEPMVLEEIEPASEGISQATPDFTDYFEAYRAASSAQKDLLIYCFAPDLPGEAQIEFETDVLADPEIRESLDERFVLVKISTEQPVQTKTTVRKTRYVRQGFRRVQRTYNQVVTQDLFDGSTRRPGLLVVSVTDQHATASPDVIARFPFGYLDLPPHVYRVNHEFKPWTAEVFRDVVSTPVTSTDAYLEKFCSKQSLDRSCVQRAAGGKVSSLSYVYFDYDYTSENLKPDRITTRLHIAKNTQLASYQEPIAMRIDAYSLRDSGAPVKLAYCEVLPNDEWQTIDVDELKPETPYRLTAYFYTSDSSHQLLGEAEMPLYAVTNGPEKVAQARAEIAMKALGEVRDWRRGSYDRRKGYVVGRWCERFYFWNILNHVRTPFRTSYSSTTFSRHNALFTGRRMRNMVQNQNVMGDHIRIRDHGFMVLSYDKHLGQAWTIEGNFGNRVVLTRRYVSDYWSLGTIVPSMLLEGS